MDGDRVAAMTDWERGPDREDGLAGFADRSFSGAVTDGVVWVLFTNGRIVGVFGGDIDEVGADLDAYRAPDSAVPLLFSMQERGGERKGQYYTEETPLREVDETLSGGGFVGYVELAENVLSGDYYVVYYGGDAMPVAFVGTSRRLLTGDEAFDRAADEVGIYDVYAVDVTVTDIPESSGEAAGSSESGGEVAGSSESGGEVAGSSESDEEVTGAAESGGEVAGSSESDGEVTGAAESGGEATGAAGPDREATEAEDGTRRSDADDGGERDDDGTETAGVGGGPGTAPDAVPERADQGDGGPNAGGGAQSGPVGRSGDDERVEREGPPNSAAGESTDSARSKSTHDGDTDGSTGGSTDATGPGAAGRNGEERAAGVEQPSGDGTEPDGRGAAVERTTESEPGQATDAAGPNSEETAAMPDWPPEADDGGAGGWPFDDGREEVPAELSRVRRERDELRTEVDRLRDRVAELEAELTDGRGEGDGIRDLDPDAARSGTNFFVRYRSKADPTLSDATEGAADRDAVDENLRIEHHTSFETDSTTVAGEQYADFLRGTVEYRFVDWLARDLIYELRDTGRSRPLGRLYRSIPAVDRAELGGSVAVAEGDEGASGERRFDVVVRDRKGKPLVVASMYDGREPATERMLADLVEDARAAAAANESLGAAVFVTTSYYTPDALELAERETESGGLFGRGRRESYVRIDRERGYHLCLVEARNGGFHLSVPDL